MRINSHNDWDPLKEIIVGSAEGTTAVLTWPRPDPILPRALERAQQLAREAYPKWFVDEVNEDLDNLANTIRQFGVKVHRPTVHDISRMYSSPHWSSTGNNIYNVRDLNIVIGDTVVESPSPIRSRYFETNALYPIWYDYLKEGFRWICGPKPNLAGPVVLPYFRSEDDRVLTQEDVRYRELTDGRVVKLHKLVETEILFEAANILRLGKDLLYLVSSAGNYVGAQWLQHALGDSYRVHTTDEIYRAAHIDSTILALRPGLVLLNDVRVSEKTCPALFKNWEKIWFSDVAPVTEHEMGFQRDVRDPLGKEIASLGFETNLELTASPWVGMNFLSIDPNTVLVDARQEKLIRVLEKHKLTVVRVPMRHIYTQGGGLHCATLDTVRESKLESYFD